jgi:predicted dehydrogenase
MIRVGVIGVGNMGSFHASLFKDKKINNTELTAICDIDPKRLERFKDFKTFTDSKKLIRSGTVDAVVIATPHYAHTTIGMDALKQGLHVLVEKPLSVHKADCEKLLSAHVNKKQVFAIMFNLRTDPHYKAIKKMVEDGELGKIQRINYIITDVFRSEAYYASGSWRATWRGEGGGVLLNQCPHNLDLLQWFCGLPVRVRAFCSLGKYHKIEVEDEVTAYLEYANGATGIFLCTTGEAPGTNRLEIAGDKGKIIYENGTVTFFKNDTPTSVFTKTTTESFGKPKVTEISVPVEGSGGQHQEIIQNFVNAIADGVPLIAQAEEGISSVELGNAMLFSSLTGKTVELPMNSAAYKKRLMKLIKESKLEKKVQETITQDMTQSFH